MAKLQFSEAEHSFEKALQVDPRSVDALVALGRLALIKQQRSEALQLLDRALSLHPHHAEALAVKGIYYMETDEFVRAIEVLEQAKSSDSRLQMVYFNLGKCYCEVGQFAKAEESLRRAIEMNPDHYEAYSQLSYVEIQTGRMEEGIHAMVQAIRINPLYIKGYLIIGALYESAGKGELVIELYKDGLRHNPNAFPLRERLCSLYALKLDFRSAYLEALEIVNRRENSSEDYLRLGTYAVALRKLEAAEKAFQTAIELNPDAWEGHYNLGELYMSREQMPAAREQYEAAVAKNRASYKPLNGMGLFLLLVDHNWDEAIGFFKQALELAPAQTEPRLNLALAYAKKRDFPAARRFTASVLELAQPGDRIYEEAERLQATIGTLSVQSVIRGRTGVK
jgi:tetratricopeptide (TPR) repeat protein